MARALKRFGVASAAANAHVSVNGAAVAGGKAQVGRVVVSNNVASPGVASFHLSIGAAGGGTGYIAIGMSLAQGETFEQQVVVPAGEQLWVASVGGAGQVVCAFMCEEVDN